MLCIDKNKVILAYSKDKIKVLLLIIDNNVDPG